MAEITNDIKDLLDKLYAKENRRLRYTIFYLGAPIVLGLALILWTAMTTREVQTLKNVVDAGKIQLAQAREASDYIREGVNYAHAKNFTAAIKSYDKAIESDPLNPVAYNLKGYALLRKGLVKEAIKELKNSIEVEPTYIWAHYNLSLALWSNGEKMDAVAEVRKVLELDPSFSDVIWNDGQFIKFRKSAEFKALLKK